MPRTCAVIPARGGSKRVPRKNLQQLGGRSLLQLAVEQARAVSAVQHVCVSSEDEEILRHAASLGVDVIRRPASLARDDTPGIEPVLHAARQLGLAAEDEIVLLQPTSPFRAPEDIAAAISLRRRHQASSCVSVRKVEDHPAWMFRLADDNRLQPFRRQDAMPGRSQDLAPLYVPNGAVYVATVGSLRAARTFFTPDAVAYVMPEERSLDIDTPFQLRLARALWALGDEEHRG